MDQEQVEEFYMFRVKIEMCDLQEPHNHSTCPYKHPGELCTRRDPRVFRYDSIFCYDLHNNGVCHRGVNCPYSHNKHEYFLHPTRFRTRMCEFGDACVRELCFFAHNEAEVRPRVPIKVFSNTRCGGRRPRPAPATSAAPAERDNSSSGASTEAGSLLVSILQAPSLPYVAFDSISTADGKLPLTLAKQAALSGLPLGQLGAAGPQMQTINSSPAAGQSSRQALDPVNKASTGMQQLPLLFLQDMLASDSSSADMLLPCQGFDLAASAAAISTEFLAPGMLQALPSALDYPFPQDLNFSAASGGSSVLGTQSLSSSLGLLEPMLSGMAGNSGILPELQTQGSLLAYSTPAALQDPPGSSPGNSSVSYALLGTNCGSPSLYAATPSVLTLQQQQHAQLATSGGAPCYLPGPELPVGSPASSGCLSTVTVMGPGPAMAPGKRYILVPMDSPAGIAASRPANEPHGQLPLQLLQVNGSGAVLACNRAAPACGQQYQAPMMLMQPLQQLL